MAELVTIPVSEIREGDELIANGITYWTAVRNANRSGGKIHLDVQYVDGGTGTRVWDNPFDEVTVTRG
jgi:hypothetical protein